MKKTILALALATAASFAAAQTISSTFDSDHGVRNSGEAKKELSTKLAFDTKYGTFDGVIIGNRQKSAAGTDNALGFELGYSRDLKLDAGAIVGRAAYGRLNQVDPNGGGYTGNLQYYSLSAEYRLGIAQDTIGFVGVRHRNTFNSVGDTAQNRFTVGAEYKLSRDLTVRAGLAHTLEGGKNYNGIITSIAYRF